MHIPRFAGKITVPAASLPTQEKADEAAAVISEELCKGKTIAVLDPKEGQDLVYNSPFSVLIDADIIQALKQKGFKVLYEA